MGGNSYSCDLEFVSHQPPCSKGDEVALFVFQPQHKPGFIGQFPLPLFWRPAALQRDALAGQASAQICWTEWMRPSQACRWLHENSPYDVAPYIAFHCWSTLQCLSFSTPGVT